MHHRTFFALALALLTACGDSSSTADAGHSDAAASDATTATEDTGTGAEEDAAPSDAGASQSNAGAAMIDVGAGAMACFLNSECAATERCDCVAEGECFCMTGTRGTGVNGVDACESGNDCASGLCVEGPTSAPSPMYCSDDCSGDSDCTGMLPRCLNGLGICARSAS